MFRNLYELTGDRAPVVWIEDSAAAVRVNADNLGSGRFHQALEIGDFKTRHAKLGMHAGRLHMLVMTTALPRINPHEQLLSSKQLRPCLQRKQIVERDLQAALQCPCIFGTRREVWRKQDAFVTKIRNYLLDPLDLARRHTLEINATGVDSFE